MADETLFTDILTRLRPGYKAGGRVGFDNGGSAREKTVREILKKRKAFLKNKLNPKDFAKLDFFENKPIPNWLGEGRINDYYGISQRKNKSLFRKVRSIVEGIDMTAVGMPQVQANPKIKKKLFELVKKGDTSEDVLKILTKEFPSLPKTTKITNLVNSYINAGELSENFRYQPGTGRPKFKVDELKNKVIKIVDEGVKNKNMPSLSEITRRVGLKSNRATANYIELSKGKDFIAKNFPDNTIKQTQYIKTLAKDLKIQEGFKNGRILDDVYVKRASDLLGIPEKQVYNILGDVARTAEGNKTYIKKTDIPILGKKGIDAINKSAKGNQFGVGAGKKKITSEVQASKAIGEEGNFFNRQRRKGNKIINKTFKDLGLNKKGVTASIDEIASVAAGSKGSAGSSLFTQTIPYTGKNKLDNINTRKGSILDQRLSNLRTKALKQPLTIQEINDYNKISRNFTDQINNTLPKNSKKLKSITIVPNGDPLKTMPDIKKIKKINPTAYNNILSDAKKYKFSYRIPKGSGNLYDFNDADKVQKGITKTLQKAFGVESTKDLKNIIKATPAKEVRNIVNRNIAVLSSDITGIGALTRNADSLSAFKPIARAFGKAKPVFKGLGKAAVVIDPVFAAMDFSKAQEEGLSGGQSGIFAAGKFIQDIANLPRTIEDLAYLATEEGTLKNFGQKKDRLLGDAFKAEFADNYLKRKIDETPTATKDYRKANIRYDQSMPNFYDDIEVSESQDVLEARKNAYLKSQGVSKPKKEGIGSFFTNPRITGIYEDEV